MVKNTDRELKAVVIALDVSGTENDKFQFLFCGCDISSFCNFLLIAKNFLFLDIKL
jgi:hypothetical protein